jgi:hypothetical protein
MVTSIVLGLVAVLLLSAPAGAKTCTAAELREEIRWGTRECSNHPPGTPPGLRPAEAPSVSDIGVSRWVDRLIDSLRLVVASAETMDRAEWRRQRGELTRLLGEASAWPSHTAWAPAKAHCSQIVQAMLDVMSGLEAGTARGKVLADRRVGELEGLTRQCMTAMKTLP